jgi:hypothetical protein
MSYVSYLNLLSDGAHAAIIACVLCAVTLVLAAAVLWQVTLLRRELHHVPALPPRPGFPPPPPPPPAAYPYWVSDHPERKAAA